VGWLILVGCWWDNQFSIMEFYFCVHPWNYFLFQFYYCLQIGVDFSS
jgi:hypothetical protein